METELLVFPHFSVNLTKSIGSPSFAPVMPPKLMLCANWIRTVNNSNSVNNVNINERLFLGVFSLSL